MVGIVWALYRTHRTRIFTTYGLTLAGNVLALFIPTATGWAINDLLAKHWQGLAALISVWIVYTAVGVVRQRFDTRTFTTMYTEVATRVMLKQSRAGIATSSIGARSVLAREFADFFERDVPLVITVTIGFAGAIAVLFAYDIVIGLSCLAFLLPVWAVTRGYARWSSRLNRGLNDQLEREVSVLSAADLRAVRTHYSRLAMWRVNLSDAEAWNWGVLEACAIALAALVVMQTTRMPSVQAGTIYAIMAYLREFVASLDSVPFIVQQLVRLRDISVRTNLTNDACATDDEG
jgi:ABC-type multidrug transport system fused ATPase/permease subunit